MPASRRPLALITGATSGIGAAFARRLAREGYDLIVHGRREEKLRNLADRLSSEYGRGVEVRLAELADCQSVAELERTVAGLDNLRILVNNAGFTFTAPFAELDADSHEAILRVQTIVPMRLARAALPGMLRRNAGAVINVASVAGFTPGSNCAAYNTAKAALVMFSEALHLELIDTGVRVQALCPGWTRTEFHTRRGIPLESLPRALWMSPERVVSCSLQGLKRGAVVCVPGWRNKLLVYLSRAFPRSIYFAVAPRVSRLRRAMREKATARRHQSERR